MQIVFTDGLGNQMFQYALFLAMKSRGHNPKINTGIINRNIVHNGFELCDVFNINKDDLHFTMQGHFAGGITIFINRYLKLLYYQQNVEMYSDGVFHTHRPFIFGYWQDIRYFEQIQDEIHDAFSFRNIDKTNIKISNELERCNSISLHIRRGDYLKYTQYQICTPLYYKHAIDYIKEKIADPIFYVFSDDLDWSEQFMREMNVSYKIISQNRGRDSYKDMYLMTCCHHNIIANSSFSWWGAWLGKHPRKIVICPNEWVKGYNISPCLDNWVKIQTT